MGKTGTVTPVPLTGHMAAVGVGAADLSKLEAMQKYTQQNLVTVTQPQLQADVNAAFRETFLSQRGGYSMCEQNQGAHQDHFCLPIVIYSGGYLRLCCPREAWYHFESAHPTAS